MSTLVLQRWSSRDLANNMARAVLLVYLGFVLCPIRYSYARLTVDNTWVFALNYAAAHHLLVGRDIAFGLQDR